MQVDRRTVLAGLAGIAAAGAGASSLAAATPDLSRARARARGMSQLWSLVVAVDGQEVLAERRTGPALDAAVNVKSVSKTLVATLAGVAVERGDLPGLDAPMMEYLGRRAPSGIDPRVEGITVRHLITMTSGLEGTSGARYGSWVQSRDWVGYVLSRPMLAEPGRRRGYSTGDYHLLGAVLAEATGASLLEQARERIGRPLGIDLPAWTRDPQGLYMGGNNMAMSPRGMIAFGEAMRRGGRPVVSRAWIEEAWEPSTRSPFSGHDYGLGWFLARFRGERVAYARGYGGQMIYVLPDLGTTVAVTSDPTLPARSGGHAGDLNALVADEIVPAVRRA
jgi:CubicO group peptidase (beta-lactamase class C family)